MLKIRRKQIEQMQTVLRADYHARLLEHVRAYLPALVTNLNDSEAERRIDRAVQAVRARGECSDEATLSYVALSLAAGDAFDADLDVARFLSQGESLLDKKVQWLLQRVLQILTVEGVQSHMRQDG
jgi:hypothetical protein